MTEKSFSTLCQIIRILKILKSKVWHFIKFANSVLGNLARSFLPRFKTSAWVSTKRIIITRHHIHPELMTFHDLITFSYLTFWRGRSDLKSSEAKRIWQEILMPLMIKRILKQKNYVKMTISNTQSGNYINVPVSRTLREIKMGKIESWILLF